MLFNSFQFILFYIIVLILYYKVNHKFRWILLLLSSCIFYMYFKAIYILILLFTIVIDYFAGILLETTSSKYKKMVLLLSLIANIGILVFYKYFNFFNENLGYIFHYFKIDYSISNLSFLLPIGLSFHTFQAMSYTIEIYRGKQKAERHFGIYALYKGYSMNADSVHTTTGSNHEKLNLSIVNKQIEYLIKMINLCNLNNKKLTFVYAPIPKLLTIAGESSFLNRIKKLSKESKCKLYNFHRMGSLHDLYDLYDSNHLNKSGVEKFNSHFIKELLIQ